jgi:catechol 2,3-dioxygenase-like lactoylglutathione lyase family enzyme
LPIDRLDHLARTVAQIERSCEFYRQIFGFEPITFADERQGLVFGRQKINRHRWGREFEPQGTASHGRFRPLILYPRRPRWTL